MNTRKHLILSLVVSCTLLAGAFGQTAHAVEDVGGTQAPLAPLDLQPSLPLAPAQTPPHAPDRLIVKLRGGTSSKAASTLRAELRATVSRELRLIGAQVWHLDGVSVEQAVAQYQDHPDVVYIEPDYVIRIPQPVAETEHDFDLPTPAADNVPNDPLFGQLWGMEMIDAPLAWDIQTGSDNVIVGIIDTGIDYTHPDLAAHVWTNPNEIPNNSIDDDGNGYVDDMHGWDFFNDDNDPMDDAGHGTHVAGTITAVGNNGVGVTGVNWSGRVMALKFLGSQGYGYTSNAVAAVEYATQMGVSLTNNSWGGGEYSQALYDAIAAAGANGQLFIASAGNSNDNNDEYPSYPNSYDLDNIIAVAATDSADQKADFSSYGFASTDLGAPGVKILSTLPITSRGCGTGNDNGYGSCNGTSMAAPHVSGVAALVWSQFPGLEWSQVKHRILASTDPVSDLTFTTVSGGRLNAHAALTYAGGPIIEPRSLRVGLGAGERVTRTITIGSLGVDSLNWHIDVSASWVQATPISGTSTLSHPATVTLVIDSKSLSYGITNAILTVTPDDPELGASRLPIAIALSHALLDAPQTMLAMGSTESNVGRRVALDGDVALVYNQDERIAQVLRTNGTVWFPPDQLSVVPGSGHSMAVSDDRLLIGSAWDQAACVYQWDGEDWIVEATLYPSDGPVTYFGGSGDIDGDVAVVGAPNTGVAYVYRWNGSDWIEEDKLMPDTNSYGFANGFAVATSGDTIIIGDWNDSDQGSNAGAAYVYHWDGTSWAQQAKLTAPDGQPDDLLGRAVSIYDDVAVACTNSAAYVYRRAGDQWRMEEKLANSNVSSLFAYSVDVTHNLIAIGDPGDHGPDGFQAGAVYVYHWNGYRWGEAKVIARDRPPCSTVPGLPPMITGICDWFGISVAIDKERMLAGSPAYDQAGAAFLYDMAGLTVEHTSSLGLAADDFVVSLEKGASVTRTMHVVNPGAETLEWSISPQDNVDWLDVTPISGTLLPGESQTIELTFKDEQEQAANYRTALIILSNDPFGRRVEIPITLHVGWTDFVYLPLVAK
ncbi:MAG: S8 family serine peptidase [Chloroflexi bacterium]|nr:S8 family serine peptidase [Chloroflexota bacterium]